MQLERDTALAPFTTLQIGGSATFFVRASALEDIRQAVCYAKTENLPIFVLGGGSNVLISDLGFSGVVIKNELRGISFKSDGTDAMVTVAAGECWDAFVEEAVRRKLYGIENLSGIPGTVGAAPIQNIGAYGAEVSNSIEWVEVFDTRNENVIRLTPSQCLFGYRDSIFKHPEGKYHIIISVHFRLRGAGVPDLSYKDLKNYFEESTEDPSLHNVRNAVLTIRRAKFPHSSDVGTAGSFFKNLVLLREEYERVRGVHPDIPSFPMKDGRYKISLAWILDRVCNLKGTWYGNVGMSKCQPLVLVTRLGATAHDVEQFADSVEKCVYKKIGVHIEREVTFVT